MSLRVCVVCSCSVVQDLEDPPEWVLHFRVDGSVDRRRYNAPTTADVAGFMPGGFLTVGSVLQLRVLTV
jgi:hypothetical protein